MTITDAPNLWVPPQPFGWDGHARLEKYRADDDVRPVLAPWLDAPPCPLDGALLGAEGRDLRDEPVWQRRAEPFEVIEAKNLILTAGATYVLGRITSDSAAKLNATTGYMAVGNGTTAVSAGQTDLQGASKTRKVLDATPSVSGNQLQAVCTFTTADANHSWDEAGLANASSGATLVNRFLQTFGVKTSAVQWILTITVTLA